MEAQFVLGNGVSNHLDYTAPFFLKGLKFLHIFIPWWLQQHVSVAKRSDPELEVRSGSQEELPHARGQGWRQRGATLRPR